MQVHLARPCAWLCVGWNSTNVLNRNQTPNSTLDVALVVVTATDFYKGDCGVGDLALVPEVSPVLSVIE